LGRSERLIIPFKGLKDGWHEFFFMINQKFFQSLDYSEFEKGELSVKVKMDKKPSHLVLKIEIDGKVNVMCDRCLDYFDIDSNFSGTLIVKFSNESNSNEENDELMIIPENEHEVDITHYVYETVCLSLPFQRYHPVNKKGESSCNKEMILKLKELKAKKQGLDNRWEKLKEINNN
jgi:uncharacterized metal-binding protein YceD (DUF177 family)